MSAPERTGLQENADRLIEDGTPEQKDAAQRVIAAIAAQEGAEHATLLAQLSGLSAGQRVVEAFRAVRPTDVDRTVMKALLDNPGKTSTELSEACGWGGQTWHMFFGTMCARRIAYLWPAPTGTDGIEYFTGVFADLGEGNRWTMKDEVAAALATIGIRAGG